MASLDLLFLDKQADEPGHLMFLHKAVSVDINGFKDLIELAFVILVIWHLSIAVHQELPRFISVEGSTIVLIIVSPDLINHFLDLPLLVSLSIKTLHESLCVDEVSGGVDKDFKLTWTALPSNTFIV